MIARQRALQLRAIAPDPYDLADHLNVRTITIHLPPWLAEVWLPSAGLIAVNACLDAPTRRWYLAHALGHVELHSGDQRFLLRHTFGMVACQESQAERFAAWFLAPTLTAEALASLPLPKRGYRIGLETVAGLRAA